MLLMPFYSSNTIFEIPLSSFKYFKIFILNITDTGNRLACVWFDIPTAAEVQCVTDNLSPPTYSLFLLNGDDVFKVNWNHSDLSNICPLRRDSKLTLITNDLQIMVLLFLWSHSCCYTGFPVQDVEKPRDLWEYLVSYSLLTPTPAWHPRLCPLVLRPCVFWVWSKKGTFEHSGG